MNPLLQRTIKNDVRINGVGIHKGKKCSVVLRPAEVGTGIRFISSRGSFVAALPNLAVDVRKSNTTLSQGDWEVETVEHLLSCLYGLFISNLWVEMQGDELPIGDGSARHFYDAIQKVGAVDQEHSCRCGLVITEKMSMVNGSKYVTISPSKELVIDCTIDWHPNIKGRYVYTHKEGSYSYIAYARTFAERKYVSKLKKSGWAAGVKLGENCIDISDKSSMSKDECVKHKVLDILGDFSLLYGYRLLGKITAKNSGHNLHHKLLRELLNVRK